MAPEIKAICEKHGITLILSLALSLVSLSLTCLSLYCDKRGITLILILLP